MTVKATIQGRPPQVNERGDHVTFALSCRKHGALPKGVPTPEKCEVTFTCFVAKKQWLRCVAALEADVSDSLIVEGYPYYDDDLEGLALLATSCVTIGQRKAAAQKGASADPKAATTVVHHPEIIEEPPVSKPKPGDRSTMRGDQLAVALGKVAASIPTSTKDEAVVDRLVNRRIVRRVPVETIRRGS